MLETETPKSAEMTLKLKVRLTMMRDAIREVDPGGMMRLKEIRRKACVQEGRCLCTSWCVWPAGWRALAR